MKRKVLHGYVLQHSDTDGWHLLTSFGAMVGVWGRELSKTAALTMAVWLMHEFANRGQHSELRVRNKNGKFGPARTYPRGEVAPRDRGCREDGEGMSGWIGVDLDGTLAQYGGFKGPDDIGEPIPAMLERVKKWIAEGREVRIFTARVCEPGFEEPIKAWCEKHGIGGLAVTNAKDFGMVELWGDRAVRVMFNKGERCCDGEVEELKAEIEHLEDVLSRVPIGMRF